MQGPPEKRRVRYQCASSWASPEAANTAASPSSLSHSAGGGRATPAGAAPAMACPSGARQQMGSYRAARKRSPAVHCHTRSISGLHTAGAPVASDCGQQVWLLMHRCCRLRSPGTTFHLRLQKSLHKDNDGRALTFQRVLLERKQCTAIRFFRHSRHRSPKLTTGLCSGRADQMAPPPGRRSAAWPPLPPPPCPGW